MKIYDTFQACAMTKPMRYLKSFKRVCFVLLTFVIVATEQSFNIKFKFRKILKVTCSF